MSTGAPPFPPSATNAPAGGGGTGAHDERVERAFAAALEAGPTERRSVLDGLGLGDATRAEVESLLRHAQETREFLESPLLPGVAAMEVPLPEKVGHFKVIGLLGEGGMGRVYEAEQERPNRRVAVKVVRSETLTPGALRRFDREIQTLGQLKHPCIAQLYGGGQDAGREGRATPYLAMELVRGVSLTRAAKERGLSVRERVELLARIADAVQYAHQRGVVHLDLKPENILVEAGDGAGGGGGAGELTPKILDFGIARLMDAADHGQTLAGGPMGTLAYMAPEQFLATPGAIDTRCDVYALGVIAYELFAGARPLDVTGMSVAQAARLIETREPARLGTIERALRGDVETIVAKAMAKDREQRYASAGALADDLRRYLKDEPIVARAPSAAYQIAKFAKRNRVLVTVAGAGVAAMVAGLVASTTLYVREQHARQRAAASAALSDGVRDYLIQGLLLSASPSRMGYDVKMMDVLTKASEGLHERFKDNPDVEAQVRSDLGSVLGDLGKYKESEQEYREALRLHTALLGARAERTVRDTTGVVNALLGQERVPEALALAREAIVEAKAGPAAAGPASLSLRANLGAALHKSGKYDESMAILNEGLALAERDPVGNANALSSLLSQLAACESARGRHNEALGYTRRLVEHARAHSTPDVLAIATADLINALIELGDAKEAVALAENLPAQADKAFPPEHRYRAYMYSTTALALLVGKQADRAEPYALRSYEILDGISETDWDTERAVKRICSVYQSWPGHEEQLLRWSLVGVKIRLMLGSRPELQRTLGALTSYTSDCLQAGCDLAGVGLQGRLWEHRDELVPANHPRRAVFFANYALLCDAIDPCPHAAEALALAEEAMAYVRPEDREKAKELITLGRKRIVDGNRPPMGG